MSVVLINRVLIENRGAWPQLTTCSSGRGGNWSRWTIRELLEKQTGHTERPHYHLGELNKIVYSLKALDFSRWSLVSSTND